MNDLLERLEAMPEIVSATVASAIPFGDDEPRNAPIRRPDDLRPVDETTLRTDLRAVSLNFFDFLQMPLLRGRPFAPTDQAESPRVAIVNETLARRLDPSGNVLGQTIRVGTPASAPVYQIVGVVANTRWWGASLDPLNEVYYPFAQDRASFGFVMVQSQLDPAGLTKSIRTAFNEALPGASQPAERRARTLDEMIGRSVAGQRFNATLVSAFSLTALMLAVIGLFGLVTYSMSQRRQELGIRAALGARPGDLIATSMRSAIVLTAIGIVVGLATGAYLTRFIESQLYAIEPLDVPTFAAAAGVMIVAAALAAFIPARRAVHSDPMVALRYE